LRVPEVGTSEEELDMRIVHYSVIAYVKCYSQNHIYMFCQQT
jgi:hypothetical protein